MNTPNRNIFWGLLMIICGAALFARLQNISTYTSEMDDHIVATSILKAKEPVDMASIRYSINDTSKSTYNSFPKRTLRKLDAKNKLERTMHFLGMVGPYFAVSNQTTYAPFQFFFTQFLVNKDQVLQSVLLHGRIPSVVFSMCALFLFCVFLRRYFQATLAFPALAYSLLVLGLSYEYIIYSKQMESYAIGLFAFLGYSILLLSLFKKENYLRAKPMIFFGLLSALFIWMQYQMLFFVTAGYAALVLYLLRKKQINKTTLKNGMLSIFFFLVLFMPVYLLFLSKHADHITAHLSGGSRSSYYFPAITYHSFVSYLKDVTHFFVANTLCVFQYMTLFMPPDSVGAWFFFGINLSLFVMGLVKLKQDTDPIKKFYTFFLVLSALVWIGLVLKGGITLSPNRHSLILLPAFCIVMYCGFEWLLQKTDRHSASYTAYLPTLAGLIAFFFYFPPFFADRKEPFLRSETNSFFTAYRPDCVISKDDIVFIMPEWYGQTDIFFKSDDKSLERWLARRNKNAGYQRIALVGFSATEAANLNMSFLQRNAADTTPGFAQEYKPVDSLKINSRTDEVHTDFTRWVNLQIRMFYKIKP